MGHEFTIADFDAKRGGPGSWFVLVFRMAHGGALGNRHKVETEPGRLWHPWRCEGLLQW